MQVNNGTGSPVYATVEGRSYEVLPGGSVEVDSPRTAMLLAEYGLTVNRSQVDDGLIAAAGDATVENVQTPFSMHGPGTDVRGNLVDPDAASAFADAVDGDTSKTVARVQAVGPVAGAVVAEQGDGETISSTGETVPAGESSSQAEGGDDLRGAALDAALRSAGLSTSGTVAEKQERLRASQQ